jgi:ribosomal-protein-alanine N-acetyltransferase
VAERLESINLFIVNGTNHLLNFDFDMTNTIPHFAAFGLSLREIRAEDAASWFGYLRIPEVVRLNSWNVSAVEDMQAIIEKMRANAASRPLRFALVAADTDRLVGTIGFHSLSIENASAEIAYDLAPEYWGRGIISAACEPLIRWGFNSLQLNRIQGCAMVGNHASARILEKTGFKFEGILREFRYARGRPSDFWVYSRLRSD